MPKRFNINIILIKYTYFQAYENVVKEKIEKTWTTWETQLMQKLVYSILVYVLVYVRLGSLRYLVLTHIFIVNCLFGCEYLNAYTTLFQTDFPEKDKKPCLKEYRGVRPRVMIV